MDWLQMDEAPWLWRVAPVECWHTSAAWEPNLHMRVCIHGEQLSPVHIQSMRIRLLTALNTVMVVSRLSGQNVSSPPCRESLSKSIVVKSLDRRLVRLQFGHCLQSWRFFQQRIEWEDSILLRFFGDDFLRYKQRISSGIPFIR